MISSEAQTLHTFFETERYFDKHYNALKQLAIFNVQLFMNLFPKMLNLARK
ncbi:MAG: hypothetical protein V3T59_10235 [Desulfobacterales bacterium]